MRVQNLFIGIHNVFRGSVDHGGEPNRNNNSKSNRQSSSKSMATVIVIRVARPDRPEPYVCRRPSRNASARVFAGIWKRAISKGPTHKNPKFMGGL